MRQTTISPASETETTKASSDPEEFKQEVSAFQPDELRQLRTDIKRSIFNIAEHCNTSLAAILQAYGQCVSPTFAYDGDSRFPRPLRQHPRDSDRSTDQSFGDLLCFLVGNATMAYHEAVLGQPAHHLRARVELLKEIAEDGPGEYAPYGSDTHGWTLMHKDAIRARQETDRGV